MKEQSPKPDVTSTGPHAAGGVIAGEGFVKKLDGRIIPFKFTSDPLTQKQADSLNRKED